MRYSAFGILKQGLTGNKNWKPVWREPEPKKSYDYIIVGGGGPESSQENHSKVNTIQQVDPDLEIDWVKLLDGSSLVDCFRDGLYVTGRKSGMRKRHKVELKDVAEYHYKEQPDQGSMEV